MTRDNMIYLVIGALVVAVAALGYQLYEAKKEPADCTSTSARRASRSTASSRASLSPSCEGT